MTKELTEDFREYMAKKYGAKGRRSIRFTSRLDELDILLGLKDAPDFDEDDKKFLNKEQLEELEKLRIKIEDMQKNLDLDMNMREYM